LGFETPADRLRSVLQ